MSVKRSVLTIVSGTALEAFVLWGVNHFVSLGLDRINWRSVFVWVFFFAGFLTAVWLYLWSKLMGHLFGAKRKTDTATTPAPTTPVQTQTIAAPIQAAPIVQTPPVTPATPVTPAQPAEPAKTDETTIKTPPMAPKPSVPRMAPPVRMAVQNNAVFNVNPNDPTTAVQTPISAPAAPQQPKADSSKERDIVALSDIDPDLDMMAFKHVALEGKIIDLVYSSDDVAVLCKLFSDDHIWTVDTTQPIESCTWTNEAGETQQPCGALLTQVAALQKMESEAQIIPTIVMVRGSIQNFQQVQDYLLQNKITLVQYENEKMSEATSLHDLLKENFSLYPADDEDDEGIPEDEMSDLSDIDEGNDEEPQQEEVTDGEEESNIQNKADF